MRKTLLFQVLTKRRVCPQDFCRLPWIDAPTYLGWTRGCVGRGYGGGDRLVVVPIQRYEEMHISIQSPSAPTFHADNSSFDPTFMGIGSPKPRRTSDTPPPPTPTPWSPHVNAVLETPRLERRLGFQSHSLKVPHRQVLWKTHPRPDKPMRSHGPRSSQSAQKHKVKCRGYQARFHRPTYLDLASSGRFSGLILQLVYCITIAYNGFRQPELMTEHALPVPLESTA